VLHFRIESALYIGFGDWLIDEEIDSPSSEEFFTYIKKIKTCSVSVNNFIEFTQNWVELKLQLPPFAIIYRDDNDLIYCKGFDSQENMELFVTNHTQIVH